MSLTVSDPAIIHIARDLALAALGLVFLPFSIALVLLAKIATRYHLIESPHPRPLTHHGHQPRILVTGVGMAKGLFLIRSFYLGGCRVFGADFERGYSLACGRFSSAIERFYALVDPNGPGGLEGYIEQVLKIIEMEEIDIWVSCSGVSTAIEDAKLMEHIKASTSCQTFQFNSEATYTLDNKYEFMKQTKELGLTYPKWYTLDSPDSIKDVVKKMTNGHKPGPSVDDYWVLKNVGMDDRTRGSIPLLNSSDPAQMVEVAGGLEYAEERSWIMQHYIEGGEEYCTHAVVVNGKVKAFMASPSASVLLHYRLVDPESAMAQAMLRFTQRYAEGMFEKHGTFTGHLSFDFLVKNKSMPDGVQKMLVPIECNPRCHTATVHFRGSERELTAAYLTVLKENDQDPDVLFPAKTQRGISYYWIAHDVVAMYLVPIWQYFRSQISLGDLFEIHVDFWKHLFLWRDPTFEWWDPLPFLALNHLYWPIQLLQASWSGTRWSKLNVSTTKMFIM